MASGEFFNLTNISRDMFIGGAFGAMAAGLITLIVLLAVGIYIYHALAWQRIGKNQKYEIPWLAWIPFANVSMILQMGNFHWAWVFLFLIPILGWIAIMVLITIAMWRIFDKAKYPAWLSLSYPLSGFVRVFFIVYMVIIGLVAWKKPEKKSKSKKKK